METGKVEYAPDYKLQFELAMEAGRNIAESVTATLKANAERSRLERAVIEAAKAYGRAARAVESHMQKTYETDEESKAGWQILREMESTQEQLMLEALWPLLNFESKQK